MSVILPGSYDPVTLGHLDIIRRVAEREDEVYVVIFTNPDKKYSFTLEERMDMLLLATDKLDNVIVSYSLGYVVDYMRDHEIDRIVKGYRNGEDIKWENLQAEYNKKHGGYDTELMECREEYKHISSTLVRQRLKEGADISDLVTPEVEEYIKGLKQLENNKPKG